MKTSKHILACVGALALALSAPLFAATDVNINTASANELAAALDGIGPSKAEAIISYREEHGKFSHANDITQVKGIGQSTFERNKSAIKLE